jgi:amidohydrolase
VNDEHVLGARLRVWLDQHHDELIAIRRHLHAHPEPSGQELATTAFVAERLEVAGLAPRILSGGTGLICDIEGGPGPRVALRADLDALAMDDEKDVHYRSTVPGVAHACGHDVHTTVLVAATLYLAHLAELLPGSVRSVFQPAEEQVPGGALDVIAAGALDGVDAMIGLHCEPKLDVGHVGVRPGPITSAADTVTIRLSGPGGHTARPELTVDLLRVAGRVLAEVPERVRADVEHLGPVKMVFGAVHGGDAPNVIPAHVTLRASVRTPSAEVWDVLAAAVREAVAHAAADSGASVEIDHVRGVPPVVNDVDVTALVAAAATAELGPGVVTEAPQSWGGDDFAWYLRQVPGTYVRLGTHDPAGPGPRLDLHAGHFDVDERAIAIGVRLLVAGTWRRLNATPHEREEPERGGREGLSGRG